MRECFHVELSQGRAELFLSRPLTDLDKDRLFAMVRGVCALPDEEVQSVAAVQGDPRLVQRYQDANLGLGE